MGIEVTFTIELPFEIIKKEKWYLASCPILDIHSQGDSVTKAKENLGEAIELFIVSCFERGTLDQALKECGFRAVHPHEIPKKILDRNSIKIPIPFSVLRPTGTDLCRA